MGFSEFTNLSTQEIFDVLKTSKNGLSKKDVLLGQQKYGLNEIKTRNVNIFMTI